MVLATLWSQPYSNFVLHKAAQVRHCIGNMPVAAVMTANHSMSDSDYSIDTEKLLDNDSKAASAFA